MAKYHFDSDAKALFGKLFGQSDTDLEKPKSSKPKQSKKKNKDTNVIQDNQAFRDLQKQANEFIDADKFGDMPVRSLVSGKGNGVLLEADTNNNSDEDNVENYVGLKVQLSRTPILEHLPYITKNNIKSATRYLLIRKYDKKKVEYQYAGIVNLSTLHVKISPSVSTGLDYMNYLDSGLNMLANYLISSNSLVSSNIRFSINNVAYAHAYNDEAIHCIENGKYGDSLVFSLYSYLCRDDAVSEELVGIGYTYIGLSKKAKKHLDRAIKMSADKRFRGRYEYMAGINQLRNYAHHKKNAIKYLTKAYHDEPKSTGIMDTLSKVSDTQTALKLLRKAVHLKPKDNTLRYHLSLAEYNAGHYKRASYNIRHVNKKMSRAPYLAKTGDIEVHNNLMKAYWDYAHAFQAYTDKNKSAEDYNMMGHCIEQLDVFGIAYTCYHQAVKMDGNNADYALNQGRMIIKANKCNNDNGSNQVENSINDDPTNSKYYNALSAIEYDRKNYKIALHLAEIGVALDDKNAQSHYLVGKCQHKQGLPTESMKSYHKAIKLAPRNQKYHKALKELLIQVPTYNRNTDYTQKLNHMIGLKNVKRAINFMASRAELNRIRHNSIGHQPLDLAFEGDPGTGKTTVARIFCQLLYQKHVTRNRHCVCINATSLVHSHYGKSARAVKRVIKRAMGGVLFVDEAYELRHHTDGNSVCQDEAMNEFVPDIERYNRDLVVIIAGYTKDMESFINHSNKGLTSRFPANKRIHFHSYNTKQCLEIFHLYMNDDHMKPASSQAKQAMNKFAKHEIKKMRNEPHFGNARTVRNIYSVLLDAVAMRMTNKYSPKQLKNLKKQNSPKINTIKLDDVKHASKYVREIHPEKSHQIGFQ